MQETLRLRMNDEIRERLAHADQLADEDQRSKTIAETIMPLYSYDPFSAPSEEEKIDARAQQETWDDMVRLQAEGVYPAAFASIKVPALMVHGTFDPHPGELIRASLEPFLPQLEYHEWEHCGHYPWLEKATHDKFFCLIREWLARCAARDLRTHVPPQLTT
jgi:pimeloyl-ACP methyl ester carboxylesterase